MAKPIIKFYAAPFEVNGYKGYRIQLEAQNDVYDLDFCKEIVNEKRLAMSPEELLHALEMTGEVASKKVALDGRPRGITKLIKWNRFGYGKLESPSSPWDPATCKALIRPQLLAEATKLIDATFQNVTEGIGVRLNDVTFIGAKTVQNVIKMGAEFAANGSHMEFMEGDTATLTIGERVISLTSTSSDVSHAFFTCPEIEGVEPGTQALFVMKSRGGVEGGQVYTVKRHVTILAAEVDPTAPKITGYKVDGQPVTQFTANASFVMTGDNLAAFDMLGGRTDKVVMTFTEGARKGEVLDMPYQGVSSSPRYAANLGGIYVSTPNVELVSGERGTLQVTIDGKKSNVIPFEVA